jgi:hypothetical protein
VLALLLVPAFIAVARAAQDPPQDPQDPAPSQRPPCGAAGLTQRPPPAGVKSRIRCCVHRLVRCPVLLLSGGGGGNKMLWRDVHRLAECDCQVKFGIEQAILWAHVPTWQVCGSYSPVMQPRHLSSAPCAGARRIVGLVLGGWTCLRLS